MHMKVSSLRNLSLSILTVFLLTACDDKPIAEKPSAPKVHLAKLIKVTTGNNDAFLNYPAIIKAQKLAILSFEVNGKVKDIAVKESEHVKKGAVLATLDPQDLESKIASARSQFNNSEVEYKRALRLIKGNATSQSDVDAKKLKRDVEKSNLALAQKALTNAVLKAPFDGVVSLVSLKKQQNIQAGKEAVHMFGHGGMKAIVNVPSSIIAKSEKKEEIANNSYIVLEAAPKRHIPIVFKGASLQADAASQTYPITFTFDAPKDLVILPGMNGVVWFEDPRQSTANSKNITLPLTAIATNGEQKYVWVVDETTMTVSKRNVVIEEAVGTSIRVASGLAARDTVVSAGISFLAEGMKVTAWSK